MSDSNSNEQAPFDVLIQQISSIEQARGHNIPELAALYASLANEYQNHIASGKATDLIQARKHICVEPDDSFYIQNYSLMVGKERIDLTIDPPPDERY